MQEKELKNKETINEAYNKFYSLVGVSSEDNVDVFDSAYDNVKGIITIRNKINKSTTNLNEVTTKLIELKNEMTVLAELGFDEFIEVPSNEMVYAYDMENYVRMHPEKYNVKK